MTSSFFKKEYDYKASLKETERNLSSVRTQLENKMKKPIYRPYSSFNESNGNNNTDLSFNNNINRSFHLPHGTPLSPSQSSTDSIVSSLLKNVKEQANTIANLHETMKLQAEDIYTLKAQVVDLQNRSTSNKTSYINDRKFEMFQREMKNEIENLMLKVRANSNTSDQRTFNNHSSYNLTTQKRMIEDETDAIRREIDTMKNRVVKIENESTLHARDVQDCSRRCVNVERDVTSLTDEGRRRTNSIQRKETDIVFIKKELQDISNLVNELHNRQKSDNNNRSSGSKNRSRDSNNRSRDSNHRSRDINNYTTQQKKQSKVKTKKKTTRSDLAYSPVLLSDDDNDDGSFILSCLSPVSSNCGGSIIIGDEFNLDRNEEEKEDFEFSFQDDDYDTGSLFGHKVDSTAGYDDVGTYKSVSPTTSITFDAKKKNTSNNEDIFDDDDLMFDGVNIVDDDIITNDGVDDVISRDQPRDSISNFSWTLMGGDDDDDDDEFNLSELNDDDDDDDDDSLSVVDGFSD